MSKATELGGRLSEGVKTWNTERREGHGLQGSDHVELEKPVRHSG